MKTFKSRLPLLSARCRLGFAASLPLLGFAVAAATPDSDYQLRLETIHKGYDGIHCWVHPRAGIVPSRDGPPSVVLTLQRHWVKGSDVFSPLYEMRTDDLGRTWSGPHEHTQSLGERRDADGTPIMISDFWPAWHAASGKLLGIGHNVYYDVRDGVRSVRKVRPRQTTYSIYNPTARTWSPWTTLVMPDEPRFRNAGAGCVQRLDLPNGDILLPVYHKLIGQDEYKVSVLRCGFDGTTLEVKEIGGEVAIPAGREAARGMGEPSLIKIGSDYYLTLRNDITGYVTRSRDGLHFETPRPWTWDDGTPLRNYNTQTHWVTNNRRLYLVYTRKGASNDHVFRHRAPLFMAQVDRDRLVVIRDTERIVIPERGAAYGNFGVTVVSPNETWITETELMQTWGPNHAIPVNNPYGAEGRVYVARIFWRTPAIPE